MKGPSSQLSLESMFARPAAPATAPRSGSSTTTRTVRYVGRCRKCKRAFARDLPLTVIRTETPTRTITGAEGFPRVARRYERDGFPLYSAEHTTLTCPCGNVVGLEAVHGVVTDQKCGARCMSSTGPSCECSCGGKNHGRSNL